MSDELTVTARTVGLVVNVPAFFEREDFMAWLNDPAKGAATWHKRGQEPNDYSDVFVLVDSDYEGDSCDMPEDIWNSICDLAYREYCRGKPQLPPHFQSHIVVRLTNLAE